jgi:hypothetical protein
VSACRKGNDHQPEFLVHWSGGTDKWGTEAATWQSMDASTVLAVWEKHDLREDIMRQLQHATGLQDQLLCTKLAALPKQGSSGVVGRWINATIRGQRSKAKVVEFVGRQFKLEFEQFKVGQSDPDDGVYDLLNAELAWNFTHAPGSRTAIANAELQARVARRPRH